MIAYFNGDYLPKDDIRISPDDRGFLFADGIYEVIRTYGGQLYRAGEHVRRMERSLQALRIGMHKPADLLRVAERLMEENDLGDAVFYVQITRGVAPRNHPFPDAAPQPTVYAFVKQPTDVSRKHEEGVAAILVPDNRWARCDIKSVSLLPNVLASQRANEAGVEEALFVRDGVVLEGSHTNVCAVFNKELRTYPLSNYILPGVTRTAILELCEEVGIPFREAPIYDYELAEADELMILGTSTEVMPVVQVDGRPVGRGQPGPVTRQLQEAFRQATRAAQHVP